MGYALNKLIQRKGQITKIVRFFNRHPNFVRTLVEYQSGLENNPASKSEIPHPDKSGFGMTLPWAGKGEIDT